MGRDISTKTTSERLATLLNEYYAKKTELEPIITNANNAIKSAVYQNNQILFYRTADHSGSPVFTFNLPEEQFLDQTNTAFVGNFVWSNETYPGSTDPDLDGNPVMVLAVRSDGANPNYSFLNMRSLVDTYSGAAGDGSATVTVNGYQISVAVNLSSAADNIIQKDASGKLYAAHQDISGKADRVVNASSGNLAGLNASGNLTDSGISAADVVTKITLPAANNLIAQDANGKIINAGIHRDNVLLVSDLSDYTEAELRNFLGLPSLESP